MGRGFGEHLTRIDACVYATSIALARYLFRLGRRLSTPPTKEHP